MLQQTVVATVIPYFNRFIERFPTIESLADADDDIVLGLWAGLGYYARARNLITCSRVVAARGGFPDTLEGLLALPGIGRYTAAAIGAIAFDLLVVPVDGNVERVVARLFAIETAFPAAKPAIVAAASRLGEQPEAGRAPGDFAQALFDLGATICTPRSPSCLICPWQTACVARARHSETSLPRKRAKPPRPVRHGTAYLLRDPSGRIGLRRRAPKGLLGGMLDLPGTGWEMTPPPAEPPIVAAWHRAGGIVHIFTHFELHLQVQAAEVAAIPRGLIAAPIDTPLPTVVRKAVVAGLAALPAGGTA